ncbi:MAG TPA: ligase-associated DNA damage response endonuclease PdeM, partial [Gemmatimonadales bacterium]|nr:ligase-associated DNA damage response endonuclease PdeM [Gemmatimonadales bacterium]
MSDLTIELAGESVRLLPERALYWEREEMLIAADLHWGKAAAFRAGGIPIPRGTTTADLSRIDRALARTGARRLALLGDLLHAREWRGAETVRVITAWRAAAGGLELLLIRGNHDRRAGDPPPDLKIEVVDGPVRLGPFALRHEPGRVEGAYVLAGHIHPGVTVRGLGRERLRLPCFAFGLSVGILPAFGEFTGTALTD